MGFIGIFSLEKAQKWFKYWAYLSPFILFIYEKTIVYFSLHHENQKVRLINYHGMIRVIFRSWINLVNNSIFAFFFKNRSLKRICRSTCKVCCTCCVACFRRFWISSRPRRLWINSTSKIIICCRRW